MAYWTLMKYNYPLDSFMLVIFFLCHLPLKLNVCPPLNTIFLSLLVECD